MRLGLIDYCNSAPFVMDLQSHPILGIEPSLGIPAQLNAAMARGELDVSMVSAFEALKHQDEVFLLPQWCINSTGHVKSVMLFSRKPMDELRDASVSLSSHSATSNHLLKLLLDDMGITWKPESEGEACDARLLIGDPALAFDASPYPFVHDLSQCWLERHGLPVVFALLVLRRDAAEKVKGLLEPWLERLTQVKASLKKGLGPLVHELEKRYPHLDVDMEQYFSCLNFDLDSPCQSSLQQYGRACHERGWLPSPPQLETFNP